MTRSLKHRRSGLLRLRHRHFSRPRRRWLSRHRHPCRLIRHRPRRDCDLLSSSPALISWAAVRRSHHQMGWVASLMRLGVQRSASPLCRSNLLPVHLALVSVPILLAAVDTLAVASAAVGLTVDSARQHSRHRCNRRNWPLRRSLRVALVGVASAMFSLAPRSTRRAGTARSQLRSHTTATWVG